MKQSIFNTYKEPFIKHLKGSLNDREKQSCQCPHLISYSQQTQLCSLNFAVIYNMKLI